jgi:hypothetical protein
MSRVTAAAFAVAAFFLLGAGSATASVIPMTHANDPNTVGTTLAGNPGCTGFASGSITQTFEPAQFGVSGPFRVTDLRLAWSGGLFAKVLASDSSGSPVMTLGLGAEYGYDYSSVQGMYGGINGSAIAPAGSHLTVKVLLDNSQPFFPPPVWGLNMGGDDGTTSWYADCQTTAPVPLSTVTPGTLPLSLNVVPLSREDLSEQTQELVPTLNGISPGEVNSLAQQALNGSLNDFINHLDARNKMQGSSIYDYLIGYAQLLLGSSSIGYPCCWDFPY